MVKSTQRTRSVSFLSMTAAATLVAAGLAGCGGGGDSITGTELSFSVSWEQPPAAGAAAVAADAAFDAPIPPSVDAIRFVLRPASPAPPCCIVVPRGSQAFEDRRLLLADVQPGSGSLEVHGYPAGFAPAAAGVTQTCATRPAGQGIACSTSQDTLPSFGSDEIPVDVVAGQQNVVNVDVYSLPFLLDLDPEDGGTADSALPYVDFTVVDANHDIDPDVSVRIRRQPVTAFADILESSACSDGDAQLPDCSEGGALEVHGLRISSRSPELIPAGIAELRIRASNTASPSRDMESNTTFDVPMQTTTTSTSEDSTTSTLPLAQTYCVKFAVGNAVDLVGISFDVSYGANGGDFPGSGEDVSCFSLLTTNPSSTLTSFNDDDDGTLTAAVISAETVSGPTDLIQCEFRQVPPLSLASLSIQVTEATAPDLSPASATVVIEETQCPL